MTVKNFFSNSPDAIHIEGFEVSCHVGATEEERSLPQDLVLSIAMETSLQKAGRSDNLKDTVNYALVMDDIRTLLQGKSFWLIEKVADLTATLILKKYKVDRIQVLVSKRTLPGVKSVSVHITRQNKLKRTPY